MKKNISKKYFGIVAAMCGLAASSLGICSSSVGVFYSSVIADLGIMKGTFALHATLSMLTAAIGSLFVPALLKRFSFKHLIFTGTVLATASTALMAFSKHVYLFYVLGSIRGIGVALFSAVLITMILNNWFKKSIGLCTSITFSFSGVSGAICAPVLSACINRFGWQISYLIMAAFILLFNLPALLIPFAFKPEEEGLTAYGSNETVLSGQSTSSSAKAGKSAYVSALSVTFILFAVAYTLINSITNIPQYYTVYMEEVGLAASTGASLLSCAMIGNIVFKLILGFLNDRIGSVKACGILIFINAVALVGIGLLPVHHSIPVMAAASVLFGTSYALASVGAPLLTRYFFGDSNYGHLFPIVSFMLNVGVSVAMTIMGYVYDYTGRYIFIIAAAVVVDIFVFIVTFVIGQVSSASASKRKQKSVTA